MAVALLISLALCIACTSAFMYLPEGETSWLNAISSFQSHNAKRVPCQQGCTVYQPSDLASVYSYPWNSNGGYGLTIAVPMIGDCSGAESDLAVFTQHYGLPPCTFANKCLNMTTSAGDQDFPSSSAIWEIYCSIITQSIHQAAPRARILIVTNTATDPNGNNLFQALTYAGQHANFVVSGYGQTEHNSHLSVDSQLGDIISQYKTTYFSGTGDVGDGYQRQMIYPASSPHVIAVGGTALSGSVSNPTETGWWRTTSGCSTLFTASQAQASNAQYQSMPCAGMKGVPDMAADADNLQSPAPLYVGSSGGWDNYGGTTIAAARIAGKAATQLRAQVTMDMVYNGALHYRDITQGSNGNFSCGPGYDLVTGMGAWLTTQSGSYTPIPEPPYPNGPEGCGNDPYTPDGY